MRNEFDTWNELKKQIELLVSEVKFYPKEREVWMSSLGKNIGFEQNGSGENFSRPVLIVKKFNNAMFWVMPLSTKQKYMDFYYNFTDPENRNVSIIIAQMKLVSIKRFRRKLYELPIRDFTKIIDKVKNFL